MTSKNSGVIVLRKIFMCMTSKTSRGINYAILAASEWYCEWANRALLGGRFGYFFFCSDISFFCSAQGEGDRFCIENPRRGRGASRKRGQGAGRVSAANWGI